MRMGACWAFSFPLFLLPSVRAGAQLEYGPMHQHGEGGRVHHSEASGNMDPAVPELLKHAHSAARIHLRTNFALYIRLLMPKAPRRARHV